MFFCYQIHIKNGVKGGKKMKIDLTTIIGIILALAGIGTGYMLEGGSFVALLAPSPLLIIFGGTFGVVIITQPLATIKKMPKIIGAIFKEKGFNYLETIDLICEWSKITRREGMRVLDDKKNEITEPFFKRAVTLLVDNYDPEDIKEFLENDISMMEQRHSSNQKVFSGAGAFAPTMGIIGTVLGLIVILSKLGGADIAELGHGISTAFLATFMGVASANLVFLPFEGKLKSKTQQEVLYREIVLQGMLGIYAQQDHFTLRERLISLLPVSEREAKGTDAKKDGE